MNNSNTGQQLRYLEEISISLHRVGFETKSLEDCERSILWNNAPLCRITGRGSVFYRREDADTPQAENALYRVEDIAAKTLEYMTAMEAAPQLKASGLDGDYRILADFGGTVLAGNPSKYGVQFVTWDWDYDRTGVVHGHYFMENYRRSLRLRQDHAVQSHGAVLGRAVRHADQIFVVDHGKIVQQGTHDELVAVGGLYRRFVVERQQAAGWKV